MTGVQTCALPIYGDGQKLVLAEGIGAADLVRQHLVVLVPVAVQAILCMRNPALPADGGTAHAVVVNGELGGGSAVQAVEQRGVVHEHGLLVIQGSHGVVDVLELKGLGVPVLAHKKNPIRPDGPNGDGVLYPPGNTVFRCV